MYLQSLHGQFIKGNKKQCLQAINLLYENIRVKIASLKLCELTWKNIIIKVEPMHFDTV